MKLIFWFSTYPIGILQMTAKIFQEFRPEFRRRKNWFQVIIYLRQQARLKDFLSLNHETMSLRRKRKDSVICLGDYFYFRRKT